MGHGKSRFQVWWLRLVESIIDERVVAANVHKRILEKNDPVDMGTLNVLHKTR